MESSKIIAHISVLRSSYHKPVANTKKKGYILYNAIKIGAPLFILPLFLVLLLPHIIEREREIKMEAGVKFELVFLAAKDNDSKRKKTTRDKKNSEVIDRSIPFSPGHVTLIAAEEDDGAR